MLQGLENILLGEVVKDLRAIIRSEKGWTKLRCQGPVWWPELGDTL